MAVAAKGLNPAIKVIGAEPALAGDATKSFYGGTRVENEGYPSTIAGMLDFPRSYSIVKQF